MLEDISIIRHGEKLPVGEKRLPIEQSDLTPVQQEKWLEAENRLGITNPEISYAALPKIEKMAVEIYESLPENALVIFTSTPIPRARLTADLLSSELVNLSTADNKNISVAYIWEPEMVAKQKDSLTNIPMYPEEVMGAMAAKIEKLDQEDDKTLNEYFEVDQASTAHPKEDQITFELINEDLESPDSFIKRRAELLREQTDRLRQTFKDEKRPVFFFGVGHHSSLVALDVAFNGRTKYDSVNDMPEPLALWKAEKQNE